ncbi:MAG: cadmium-translocating P-type ATPase [Clostridium sp.]|jgi:Cd2+/Zn2+-exporting ATPase|uniref:heavy metal translocating P-type ATPase n=1 Tax=Clostridium sp. TaxID=1506 RepID=UPI0025C1617E|nr:heavy metal translocating P-type ATPase [Clostridium sp.]MCH3963079.1 cadmium-translocating P-type ATPase [Clostridium sp.]MCI1716458.1 cadmium-translocating P-type ATPase [Clostridium sp.]MCI1800798.1 cadmium-translocating P-type ATPase [Clostridium sp.]MCI1814547.1 cadmium-translocating P-type ATPase [Clostridium sp.]MCI1871457.1 cadmium-translocating P-type ATPase [Clostridium sp.]
MDGTAEVNLKNTQNREKDLKKWVFILEGLDCAHCAAKIEDKVNNMPEIKGASLDFLSKKLKFEIYDESRIERTIETIKSIVNKIEPEVKIVYESEKDLKNPRSGEKSSKAEKIIFLIAVSIYIVCTIFKFSYWVEFGLYVASYIIIGKDVLIKAGKNISNGQVFDENFLMCIASIGAFSIGEFPEAVAVMLFYRIGEYFQDRAVDKSRKSIADLMDIKPDFANLKTEDGIKKVDPDYVNIGELIIVKPGEKIPLDGEIVEGNSMLDTSALTGESVPREVVCGDIVLGGYINKNGVLTVKVNKKFGQSTVAKILDLVQNASSKKSPTENFITKFARYYTPIVVAFAAALAVIPPMLMQDESFSKWLYRALVFLVVSCPCALVISVPLGFFGGIGGASKNGILVKGGNYLEALSNVDTVVFDKTGTLTKGMFKVTDIKSFNGYENQDVLKYAAFAEAYSNHPIAVSILKEYNKNVDKDVIENYTEISGKGIRSIIGGKEILAGNSGLMDDEKIQYSKTENFGTTVHIAVDKVYTGFILISDEIKEDSKSAVRSLKNIGIKNTIMLTGDNKIIGEKIANELGIDEVYTELLPDQKVEKLEYIDRQKESNKKLAYVGDGINDAPVLARSDVGIAMGGIGSDAAIEAADVVIMTDEPSKITIAIKIARRTKNIVSQNIVFALGVKAVILVLGALGIANMWMAVFGDVGVALIAVMNSMRAMKVVV